MQSFLACAIIVFYTKIHQLSGEEIQNPKKVIFHSLYCIIPLCNPTVQSNCAMSMCIRYWLLVFSIDCVKLPGAMQGPGSRVR